MFRGSHLARVDEKFRLKVPAEYKRQIDEIYGSLQFYITSRDGKAAQIYPMQEWRSIEEGMLQISEFNPVRIKFFKTTSYYGQVVDMDSQGRLLLPQKLRESAKLNEEVLVSGALTYLDVENHELMKPEDVGMTQADLEAMAELLKQAKAN
jgi:MraZ protein